MVKFKFTEKETERFNTWISFYPNRNKGTGFNLVFNTSGYFDPRPQINTNITTMLAIMLPFISLWLIPLSLIFCFYSWGSVYLRLPYDTMKYDNAEYDAYGIVFYHVDGGFPTEIWVRGYKSFQFPWSYKFKKKEVLTKNGWVVEKKWNDISEDDVLSKYYPYSYKLKNGIIQEVVAKIHEEKRYWNRWFGLHTKCRHYIEINFSSEVGERAGSWKGGTIGCSWNINKGETAYQALIRMEQERKFN